MKQNHRPRRPQLVIPTIAVVALAGIVLLGRSTTRDGGSSGTSVTSILVLFGLLALAAFVIVQLGRLLSGEDAEADAIAARLATGEDEQRLLARWLGRARWARNVGGVAGLVWWLFGTRAQGDLLVCGVAGIALGSMASELHHVRSTSGPRTASLESRSLAGYLPGRERGILIAVAVAAGGLLVAGALLEDSSGAIGWAGLALVVLVAAIGVMQRVASRPRPALPSGLSDADDLTRTLAITRGLARPAAYFVLALLAQGAGALEPAIQGTAAALSWAAWLTAAYLWWNNRRLGLDALLGRPEPVAA